MHSFDMLGEGARTEKDAARYLAAYVHAGKHIARSGVRSPQMSVKLSSLSPRFDELSRRETLPKLVASLGALVGDPAARDDDDFTIFVDAEEQNRLELTLAVVEATVREHAPKSIGVVVQAYGRRAMPTLEYLRELATTYPGTKFKVGCHTGPHTTALALLTSFLKDFLSRRVLCFSPPDDPSLSIPDTPRRLSPPSSDAFQLHPDVRHFVAR